MPEKIALIADIHSNLQALDAVLRDIANQGISRILALGDYIGDGPNPAEVLHRLRSLEIPAVRGNREDSIIRFSSGSCPEWSGSIQFAAMVWNHERLSADDLSYLSRMPSSLNMQEACAGIYMTHAIPSGSTAMVYPASTGAFPLMLTRMDARVYAYGHTHQTYCKRLAGKLLINPGSVGLPFIKKGFTQYAVLYSKERRVWPEIRYVKYDADAFIESIRKEMLPDCGPWIKTIIKSIETGEKFTLKFLNYASKLAGSENCDPLKPIPNEVWAYADKMFGWGNL